MNTQPASSVGDAQQVRGALQPTRPWHSVPTTHPLIAMFSWAPGMIAPYSVALPPLARSPPVLGTAQLLGALGARRGKGALRSQL